MSRNILKWGAATAVIGSVLAATNLAHAAGFQLKEQGGSLQGLSFAGASAKADDLSTIFFNPAGLSRIEGTQGEITVSAIKPTAEFSSSNFSGGGNNRLSSADGNGGDAGVLAAVPAMYAAYDFSDEVKFGISINTPFGLSTDYDEGWVGRFHALKSELMTITTTAVMSYNINDKLSIAAGPSIQYINGELTKAVNFQGLIGTGGEGRSILNAEDIGFGGVAGILYQHDEGTRVGLNYRSRVKHTLDGQIAVTGVPGALANNAAFRSEEASAEVTTPDILSVGAYHELNDQWAVMGELAWTNWSLFDELRVNNKDGANRELVEENWHDTMFVALGTEYQMNDAASFQFGVAYDQSAVDEEDLTFRIPDTDRYWVSLGFGYQFSGASKLNIGYTHIFADEITATEEQTSGAQGTVTGTYDSSVDILSVQYKHVF